LLEKVIHGLMERIIWLITAVQQELFLEEAIIGCYFIEERKDNKEKEMQKVVQIKIEILILC